MSTPAFSLPPSMRDVYVEYKKATAKILDWLCKSCGLEDSARCTLHELCELAENLKSANIKLPSDIDWAFQKAISSRRDISQFYSANQPKDEDSSESTARHKAFTDTLQQVYKSLTPTAIVKPAKTINTTPPKESKGASPLVKIQGISNRYEVLQKENQRDPVPLVTANTISQPVSPRKIELLPVKPSTNPHRRKKIGHLLEDDELALHMESLCDLNHLDEFVQEVQLLWARAGRGDLSFIAAATVTVGAYGSARAILLRNTAFSMHGEDLCDHCQKLNQHRAFDSFTYLGGNPELWRGKSSSMKRKPLDTSLIQTEPMPKHVRRGVVNEGYSTDLEQVLNGELPSKPLSSFCRLAATVPWSGTLDEEARILSAMQGAIPASPPRGFKEQHMLTQLVDKWLLGDRSDDGEGMHRGFGLRLLIEASRCFIEPEKGASVERRKFLAKNGNPRILVLEFVREVFKAFSAVCRCPELERCSNPECMKDLGNQIRAGLVAMRSEILNSPRFDCYSQNPLIAGMTMVSTLGWAADAGQYLTNFGHYVAMVLHAYNCCRHFDSLSHPVPILERMCDLFIGPIFLGSRPRCNFESRFCRYAGLPIQKRDRRHVLESQKSYGLGSNDYWKFARPAQPYVEVRGCRRELNHARFNTEEMRPITSMCCESRNFHKLPFWARVLDIDVAEAKESRVGKTKLAHEIISRIGVESEAALCDDVLPEPRACAVKELERAVVAELETGDLPLAKLDLAMFWRVCVAAYNQVDSRYHHGVPSGGFHKGGQVIFDLLWTADVQMSDVYCCALDTEGKWLRQLWGEELCKIGHIPLERFVWQTI